MNYFKLFNIAKLYKTTFTSQMYFLLYLVVLNMYKNVFNVEFVSNYKD